MKVTRSRLSGVLTIEPQVFGDQRGYFMESWQAQRYREAGIQETFVQSNVSKSAQGVLRGLHFQNPHAQGKLVSVLAGEVFDVAVDIRRGSPTFGQYESIIISEDNHKQFYVPPGFAHGFQVVSEIADVEYKCTDYYDPKGEGGVRWDDPGLAIPWPVDDPLVSAKDQALPHLDSAARS